MSIRPPEPEMEAPPELSRVSRVEVYGMMADIRLGRQRVALVDCDGYVLVDGALVLLLCLLDGLLGNVVVCFPDFDLQLVLVQSIGTLQNQVLQDTLVLLLILGHVAQLLPCVLKEAVEELLAGGQNA